MTPEANTSFCIFLFLSLVAFRLYLGRKQRKDRQVREVAVTPRSLTFAPPREFALGPKPILPR